MTDPKRAKRDVDNRNYAFQAYLHIQNLANTTNSSDNPLVKRALLIIKQFPNNKAIIDKYLGEVEKRLKPKLAVRKNFPNPFEPNPTGDAVDGDLKLGTVMRSGVSFGLNLNEIGQHTLITGRAGAGKTTLIYIILNQLLQRGIPFWAFDFKQDYRHLAKTSPVFVFDYKNFKFNPLRPPPGVEPLVWMQAFTNVFCQAYYLFSGSKGVILSHLEKLYHDYGVFSGKDAYPSIHDLYYSVKAQPYDGKFRRTGDFVDSVLNRLSECTISFGDMLDCDKGFPIEELLKQNVVFEIEGVLAESQSFLVSILLRHVFQYKISNNQRGQLRHVFFFDEAKNVYSKRRENDSRFGTVGPGEVTQFTTRIREFGEGLVVADQMPTELADSIKANVYTVICMSQSGGTNILEMVRTLGLNKDQDEALRTLKSDKTTKEFEAIVKLSGKWPNPFVIRVTLFDVDKTVSTQDLQRLMAPRLLELNKKMIPRTEYRLIQDAKKREEQAREDEKRKQRQEEVKQKEETEGNTLIRILTNIRDYPFVDQKTRIEMLKLPSSSSTTDKYFKELVARGLVRICRIALGRGLSTKVLYEITPEGKTFAKMDKVEIPGKGDFKHKYWQHLIKDFFQKQGYNAEIEKRFGFKNADVGFESNGNKTAIEVELSSDHLIPNLQKDFDAGCDKVIVAALSQRAINSYKKKIEFFNKDYLEKIEFRVLTDFLS